MIFRKKRKEREWKRRNPLLHKAKRILQFLGAVLLLLSLLLFLRGQVIGLATVFLLVGFLFVAITVSGDEKNKER